MKKVVSIKFSPTSKTCYFNPGELSIETDSYVIVPTEHGEVCVKVVHGVHTVPDSKAAAAGELKPIVRIADDVDIRHLQQHREEEKRAFTVCEERIAKHLLPMKLVGAEYAADHSKILFFFTADGRVDFRDLVKDLASAFRTRIELRQIGVRDEAKMLGGLGICGQPFCCNRFLKTFQPVSIKMAKEQGLSLNPTKISGYCGRLMCCLAYEQPAYEHLNKITPGLGSTVKTPDGLGTVTELNLISGILRVRLEGPESASKYYSRKECVYVRGGKRTPISPENDPPLPLTTASQEGAPQK